MKNNWLLAIPVLLFLACEPSPETRNKNNSLNKNTTDSAKLKSVADLQVFLLKKKYQFYAIIISVVCIQAAECVNKEAILELKKHGIKMAFILSTKRDSTEPLYTIRRMIVPGRWTAQGMIKAMKTTFHLK